MGRQNPYTRQAVEHWFRNGSVPPEVALALEYLLDFPKHKMRPDLWRIRHDSVYDRV